MIAVAQSHYLLGIYYFHGMALGGFVGMMIGRRIGKSMWYMLPLSVFLVLFVVTTIMRTHATAP